MARTPGLINLPLEQVAQVVRRERTDQWDLYAPLEEVQLDIGEPLGPATATQGEPEQRRSEGLTALVAAARSGTRQDIDKIMSAADAPAALPRHMIDFALDLVDSKEGRERLHDYLQTGTRDQKHLAALHFKKRGELGDEA